MHRLLLEIPTSLETERLLLRCYEAGDGRAFYDMIQSSKEHLAAELNPEELNVNEETAEIHVRQLAADWVARKKLIFGVWEKGMDALIAQVEIYPIDWDTPDFEIGYFVVKNREGQGIVTEAVQGLLHFGFTVLQAHKLTIRCKDANTRSANVAERCGFVREGHLRETKRTEDGGFRGLFHYGLLRREYEALCK